MLNNTYIHIPGVGQKTEKWLWDNEIYSWEDFLSNPYASKLKNRTRQRLHHYLRESYNRLEAKDISYFVSGLPRRELWRVFPEFRDKTVYLDIETTGLSKVFDEITLVGLSDGKEYKVFIKHHNLDEFVDEIKRYSLVVTFNGSLFDLPFIREKYKGVKLPEAHIDLRFTLRRIGFSGGLKNIENQLGIAREGELANINGYYATILWHKYTRGDQSALRLLIEYNKSDVENLDYLMGFAYQRLAGSLLPGPAKEKLVAKGNFTSSVPELSLTKPRIIKKPKPKKPALTLHKLLQRVPREDTDYPTIVGIDLTGSSKRASGWASLKGKTVKTRILRTDDELIKATLDVKPKLISIDSPLTIPKGRCCMSDDCECRKFGIVRECERQLRRWGVPVYWCLIDSMRALTKRGMELAKRFRDLGFEVIESYPGAAQDVMRIPRKKVSLDELREGLVSFGLRGDFVSSNVNHDELDAITSALVGYFYLSGHYQAVGNEDEDYLIIPKLK